MRGLIALMCLFPAVTLAAQTPQPFPTPRDTPPPPPAPRQPAPATAAPTPPRPAVPAPAAPDLGEIPIYPSAVFLTSYDAGRGQRFYLYGVLLSYDDAVAYYRSALKDRGDQLYESPPTHQFELGRFRDEMSFPPSVTVKDYTWGGAAGYVNPRPGETPDRFPTVVQIVLPPAR